MRRVLILHVGPHKTGTSYLQQRLVADRDLLLERGGVVYPRTGQEFLFGHHSLVPLFQDAADHSRELRPLSEELRDCGAALLSSERFSRLDRAQLTRVREYFSEFEIRAVAYLRVRSELLVSRWGESIKHGRDHSLPEFLSKILVAPYSSPIINQRHLLDAMSDVFGKRNLDVLVYRPTADLYAEFLGTVIGSNSLMAESLGHNARVNQSLPVHATECLRLLHSMARARSPHHPALVTARFMEYYADPAHAAEFERFRRLFDERAGVIDLAGVDSTFRHLDEDLLGTYGGNVRNPVPGSGLPDSRVAEVRYLRDLGPTRIGELQDVLAPIRRGILPEESGPA